MEDFKKYKMLLFHREKASIFLNLASYFMTCVSLLYYTPVIPGVKYCVFFREHQYGKLYKLLVCKVRPCLLSMFFIVLDEERYFSVSYPLPQ